MTDLEERIARHVYRAMRIMRQLTSEEDLPDWDAVDVSFVKKISQGVAKDILNDIKAQEKTDDQST